MHLKNATLVFTSNHRKQAKTRESPFHACFITRKRVGSSTCFRNYGEGPVVTLYLTGAIVEYGFYFDELNESLSGKITNWDPKQDNCGKWHVSASQYYWMVEI